jgi:hypothetical protein
MQRDGSRRIAGGAEHGPRGGAPSVAARPLFCLALCLLAAGCGSLGQTPGLSAQARDVSIAFESIDGVPRDISQKLVRDLNEEASALRIAVVPSGSEASYRLRGYLATRPEGSTTAIAWAWDVYDADLHRAFRLSGEERAGAPAGRHDNWAAADETLLRRIARTGMEQLVGFAAFAPAPVVPAPAPAERSGAAVASRDDSEPDPAAAAPHRRAAWAGLTSTAGLGAAASGR